MSTECTPSNSEKHPKDHDGCCITESSSTGHYRQVMASCVAHTLVIHAGINMSFSAILLPQLATTTDIELSSSATAWIVSVVAIALPFGACSIGPLMDRFGRRTMCLVTAAAYIGVWLLTAAAATGPQLCAARIVAGFSGGLSTVSLVYVSEVAHTSGRSWLLSLNSVYISFGVLLTCLLGVWCRWRTVAAINAAIAALSLIALLPLPESPHWYSTFRGDGQRAQRAQQWLTGDGADEHCPRRRIIHSATDRLLTHHNNNNNKKNNTMVGNDGCVAAPPLTWRQLYSHPTVYRPFLILVGLFVFQQLSGAYVIIFYATDVFKLVAPPSGDVTVTEFVALVALGLLRFVTAVLAAYLSHRVGRRPLLIASGIGMCLSSLLAALTVGHLSAAVCTLGYVCFSGLAYLVVPWTLIGELLPVRVRATLGGVTVAIAYALMFLTVRGFPTLVQLWPVRHVLFTVAALNLVGVVYVQHCLPETHRKSFAQIEAYFQRAG